MKVEFNGSSMKAEMSGMDTPVVPTPPKGILRIFKNGTFWAVSAVILALVSLICHFVGVTLRANYLELLPEYLIEIYADMGILEYFPRYITVLFGFGGIAWAFISVVMCISSAVILIKTTEPVSTTQRVVGVLCDGAAIIISTVVVVLSVLFL